MSQNGGHVILLKMHCQNDSAFLTVLHVRHFGTWAVFLISRHRERTVYNVRHVGLTCSYLCLHGLFIFSDNYFNYFGLLSHTG